MKYEFVNDLPEDLPVGTYNTRVVEVLYREGDMVVRLEFLGTAYENHSCLFPLTKEK